MFTIDDDHSLGEFLAISRALKFPRKNGIYVAKMLGISDSALSLTERGKTIPKDKTCAKFAEVLDLDLEQLIERARLEKLKKKEKKTETDELALGSIDMAGANYGLHDPQDKNEIIETKIAEAELDALVIGFALNLRAWRLKNQGRGALDTEAHEIQLVLIKDTIEYWMIQE